MAHLERSSSTDYELSSLSTVLSHEFVSNPGGIQEGMLLRKLEKQNKAKFKSKKFRFNILLCGSEGVGKSALREGMMSNWHLVRMNTLECGAKEYLYQINETSSFFQTCIIEVRPCWDIAKHCEKKIEEYMEKLSYSPLRRAQRMMSGYMNGETSSSSNAEGIIPGPDADGILLDERIHLCMWVFGSGETLWRDQNNESGKVPEMEVPPWMTIRDDDNPTSLHDKTDISPVMVQHAADGSRDEPERASSNERMEEVLEENNKVSHSVTAKVMIRNQLAQSKLDTKLGTAGAIYEKVMSKEKSSPSSGVELIGMVNTTPLMGRTESLGSAPSPDPEKTPENSLRGKKIPGTTHGQLHHLKERRDEEIGAQLVGQSVTEEIRCEKNDAGRVLNSDDEKTTLMKAGSRPTVIKSPQPLNENEISENFFGEKESIEFLKNNKKACGIFTKLPNDLTEEEKSSFDKVRTLLNPTMHGVSLDSENISDATGSPRISPSSNRGTVAPPQFNADSASGQSLVKEDPQTNDIKIGEEFVTKGLMREPCVHHSDVWRVMRKLAGMHEVIPVLTKVDECEGEYNWTNSSELESSEMIEKLKSELRKKLRKERVKFFTGWLGSEPLDEIENSSGDSIGGLNNSNSLSRTEAQNVLASSSMGHSQIGAVLPSRAKIPGFHTIPISEEPGESYEEETLRTYGAPDGIVAVVATEVGEEAASTSAEKRNFLEREGQSFESNLAGQFTNNPRASPLLDSHGVPEGKQPLFELFRNSQMKNMGNRISPYRMVQVEGEIHDVIQEEEENHFCEPLEKNLVQELRMQLLKCPLIVDCRSSYSDQDIKYGLPRFDGYPPYSPDFLRCILIEGCSLLLIDRTNMLFRNHYEKWQRSQRKREQLENAHSFLMSGFMVAAASAMFLLNRKGD